MNTLRPFSRLALSIIMGLLLTLIAITTIHAQKPGDLDPTFGNGGIVTTTIGGNYQWGLGIALQPDDKIVVVGEHGVDNLISFAVLRYTVTGTLDSTFNNSGFITTAIGTHYNSAWSVAVQPDGKIVVVGPSQTGVFPGDDVFSVVRYTVTGTYDSTFNGTGIVTTHVNSRHNDDEAYSVALQPDGKIVVAGHSGENKEASRDFAVVRYTPTGTLDSTFTHTGIVTTPISACDDEGRAVAIQPDGKIVVAGNSGCKDDNNANFAVVRYTITGALDSSFSNTGIVTTPIGNGNDYAFSVALQPDGKIVAAGHSSDSVAVVRYTITGVLDSTFNGTGIVTTSNMQGYKMAMQPDGKIIVAGYIENDAGYGDFAAVRYTTSGALDTTFNRTGIVTTPIGDGYDEGVAVAIQSDGKIVVAGINQINIAVVRYLNHWNSTTFVPVILKE